MKPVVSELRRRERTAVFDPTVVWALGVQTFRRCIRRKVLLVLGLFVLVLVAGGPLAPAFDPVERLKLLISLCLASAAFFGIIVAVFLAATALPEDRQEQTIITILTKPVGRFNYLLGRITGFGMTLGLILLVMGLVSWAFLRISAAASPDIVLTGKRGINPKDVHMRSGGREVPVRYSKASPDKVILKRFGPTDETLVFTFRPDLGRLAEDNVTVEITPFIGAGIKLPSTDAVITVESRAGESRRKLSFARKLNSDFTTAIEFPRDLIDPVEGVDVTLHRKDPEAFLRLGMDEVQLMAPPAPFEYSLFKAFLVLFCGLQLIVVISVTAGTFLSAWVAVLASFAACFFGQFNQYMQEYMASLQGQVGLLGMYAMPGRAAPGVGQDPFFIRAVNQVLKGVLWIVTRIVPDFEHFKATSFLTASRDVPGSAVFWALVIAVGYGVCYLILGQLVFWRREVLS